jgi:hypothetical protein
MTLIPGIHFPTNPEEPIKWLVSLKYPLLRWVVVVYGGLGRGLGWSRFSAGRHGP